MSLRIRYRKALPGSDADVIACIRARDVRGFELFYNRLHPRLSAFLLNLIRSPHMADEVLNDTMLVVWERIDDFRGDSRLTTWVFAIAYRQAMAAVRRRDEPVPDPDIEVASALPGPDEQVGRERVERGVREAMQRLSPDHRAVIDLAYFHELTCREIAQIVGCRSETVKTRMFHARRHLRSLVAGALADWL